MRRHVFGKMHMARCLLCRLSSIDKGTIFAGVAGAATRSAIRPAAITCVTLPIWAVLFLWSTPTLISVALADCLGPLQNCHSALTSGSFARW